MTWCQESVVFSRSERGADSCVFWDGSKKGPERCRCEWGFRCSRPFTSRWYEIACTSVVVETVWSRSTQQRWMCQIRFSFFDRLLKGTFRLSVFMIWTIAMTTMNRLGCKSCVPSWDRAFHHGITSRDVIWQPWVPRFDLDWFFDVIGQSELATLRAGFIGSNRFLRRCARSVASFCLWDWYDIRMLITEYRFDIWVSEYIGLLNSFGFVLKSLTPQSDWACKDITLTMAILQINKSIPIYRLDNLIVIVLASRYHILHLAISLFC